MVLYALANENIAVISDVYFQNLVVLCSGQRSEKCLEVFCQGFGYIEGFHPL